jgi:hypothetical protein
VPSDDGPVQSPLARDPAAARQTSSWIKVLVLVFALALATALVLSAQREHEPAAEASEPGPQPVGAAAPHAGATDIAGAAAPAAAADPNLVAPATAPAPSPARPLPANTNANAANRVPFDVAGPSSKADPHMAREDALRQAIESGILELVPDGAREPAALPPAGQAPSEAPVQLAP